MKNSTFKSIQKTFAKSRLITSIALKVRNQCNRILIERYGASTTSHQADGEFMMLDTLIPVCKTYCDVGANKGDWSAYILDNSADTAASLYLYEPGRAAFHIIKNRFKDYGHVHISNAAMGNVIGKLTFYEQENAGEMSSAFQSWSKNGSVITEVDTLTIDSELTRLATEHLDYLKIDTEGYDLKVLEGAAGAIKDNRISFIQFEYNSVWSMSGSTLLSAYELLESCGYKVYMIKPNGLYTYDIRTKGEYYALSNYIGIAPSKFYLLKELVRGEA